MKHFVDPKTSEWYHIDERFNVWTCDCKMDADSSVSICLTIDEVLEKEGEIRDLDRKIADRRKELGFISGETLEDGYKRLLSNI